MAIQCNSNGEEETLIGVNINPLYFGLWACPLKYVNKDPKITPEKFLATKFPELVKKKTENPKPKPSNENDIKVEPPPFRVGNSIEA